MKIEKKRRKKDRKVIKKKWIKKRNVLKKNRMNIKEDSVIKGEMEEK
jgi:hypothetical protein